MTGKREFLSDHWQCFDGIIPAVMATAARDGTPNVSYISHVYYIDEGHVALSNQFMSKTVANIMENPRLQAMIANAVSGRQILLDLMFERSENAGPLFEQMSAQVSAVAEHHGMGHVMKLRSADIYRILDYTVQELREGDVGVQIPSSPNVLPDAVRLSLELSKLEDLDRAIQFVLDNLEKVFGFGQCMVLLADAEREMLTAIASQGYERQGAGAEVPWGKGVIGIAAEKARTMRFSALGRHSLYAKNVASSGQLSRDTSRVIPMPGLENPQSLLAVPMMAGGEVRGVIFAEAEQRLAFAPYHEQAVAIIAAQLGSIVALAESSRELEAVLAKPAAPPVQARARGKDILVQYHAYDDSLFINHDYVIKGVPGRILWRMLQIYESEGRTEFTNREFRLDASLKLPEFKDNLETRLLLLSRRLAETDWPIRIARSGRGRVALVVDGRLVLTQADRG
jgi:adenylate cyclase